MIFTNPIFWIIIVAILILMAIVGYIAESMGLDKKEEPKIIENDVTNTSDVKPFEVLSEPTLNETADFGQTTTLETASIEHAQQRPAEPLNPIQTDTVETLNMQKHD